jgi:hypothetical protein
MSYLSQKSGSAGDSTNLQAFGMALEHVQDGSKVCRLSSCSRDVTPCSCVGWPKEVWLHVTWTCGQDNSNLVLLWLA